MKELKIIYKNNGPYGIRDSGGFLFFFSRISKFSDQEERYKNEIKEQYDLADFLLSCLINRAAGQPNKALVRKTLAPKRAKEAV